MAEEREVPALGARLLWPAGAVARAGRRRAGQLPVGARAELCYDARIRASEVGFSVDGEALHVRSRGREKRHGIPHWYIVGGIYFVTWRLDESIPLEEQLGLDQLAAEIARMKEIGGRELHVAAAEREYFRLMERALDRGSGAAYMNDPHCADIVVNTLGYNERRKYDLVAYAVMPNHVHVVFVANSALDDIIQEWKSVSAHRMNKVLGRRGPLWNDEYFDVLIRHSRQLERTVRYVLNNPAKAELFGWTWAGSRPDNYAALL